MSKKQKDKVKIMYDWQKPIAYIGITVGKCFVILFSDLSNINQIAPEMNLPLNFIPTQCSDPSGA